MRLFNSRTNFTLFELLHVLSRKLIIQYRLLRSQHWSQWACFVLTYSSLTSKPLKNRMH